MQLGEITASCVAGLCCFFPCFNQCKQLGWRGNFRVIGRRGFTWSNFPHGHVTNPSLSSFLSYPSSSLTMALKDYKEGE